MSISCHINFIVSKYGLQIMKAETLYTHKLSMDIMSLKLLIKNTENIGKNLFQL